MSRHFKHFLDVDIFYKLLLSIPNIFIFLSCIVKDLFISLKTVDSIL